MEGGSLGEDGQIWVRGKFLRVCQALYSSVKARVGVGSTLSEEFEVKCGLI